jgi:hypothetical protein
VDRPRGAEHEARHAVEQLLRLLIQCFMASGLMGSEYFKDVADVLGGDGPPDIEKLGEVMRRHGLTPAPPT